MVSGMRAQHRWNSTALMFWRIVFAGSAIAVSPATAPAAATTQGPAIEELLKTGWQIAGYSQAFDNRSTFILFRHPEQTYLVQCRVGYDVTRSPSVYAICYELR
jgi:hypothetical protein